MRLNEKFVLFSSFQYICIYIFVFIVTMNSLTNSVALFANILDVFAEFLAKLTFPMIPEYELAAVKDFSEFDVMLDISFFNWSAYICES